RGHFQRLVGGLLRLEEVKGYQRKIWKTCLCHSVSLLTLGLPLVIFHWKPHLEIYAKCTPCPLRQADWVLIRGTISNQIILGNSQYKSFGYKRQSYSHKWEEMRDKE
uniref:Cation-transporting ATPase n=1 Tax=Pseudonaja textilis TaxID=8673 RepID=A0A670YKI3_PSETE